MACFAKKVNLSQLCDIGILRWLQAGNFAERMTYNLSLKIEFIHLYQSVRKLQFALALNLLDWFWIGVFHTLSHETFSQHFPKELP